MSAKEPSKWQKKIDSISRSVFLDASGKPKSSVFLYAFLLSLLFLIVYMAAYAGVYWLLDRFPVFVSENWLLYFLETYLLPAVLGAGVCFAISLLFKKDKSYPFMAYCIMAGFLLIICIAFLFMCDKESYWGQYLIFLQMIGIPGFCSALCGGIPAYLVFRRWHYELALKKIAAQKEKESRPTYYNT